MNAQTVIPLTPLSAGSPYHLVGADPSNERAMRLISFGFAGGTVLALRPLMAQLSTRFQCWLAEYPGRGLRSQEASIDDLDILVKKDMLPGLRALADRPYVLLGYSFGAYVAHSLASRMREEGLSMPAAMIVLSARAPSHARMDTTPWRTLDDQQILRRVSSLGGIPGPLQNAPELLGTYLPSIRADLHCCQDFCAASSVALDVPILTLYGDRDASIDDHHAQAWLHEADIRCTQSMVAALRAGHFIHSDDPQGLLCQLQSWPRLRSQYNESSCIADRAGDNSCTKN